MGLPCRKMVDGVCRWNHLASLCDVAIGSCSVFMYWQIFYIYFSKPKIFHRCMWNWPTTIKLAPKKSKPVNVAFKKLYEPLPNHHIWNVEEGSVKSGEKKHERKNKQTNLQKNKFPGSDADAERGMPPFDGYTLAVCQASLQEPQSMSDLLLRRRTLGHGRLQKNKLVSKTIAYVKGWKVSKSVIF